MSFHSSRGKVHCLIRTMSGDNARPHTTRVTIDFFNIQTLPWPSYAPFKNPIEHFCDNILDTSLKNRVVVPATPDEQFHALSKSAGQGGAGGELYLSLQFIICSLQCQEDAQQYSNCRQQEVTPGIEAHIKEKKMNKRGNKTTKTKEQETKPRNK